jgi:hypothetical protein
MNSTRYTAPSVVETTPSHYIRELVALRRYLQPGTVPMGEPFGWRQPGPEEVAFLGEVEVRFSFYGTIRELTDDPVLQERIWTKARELGLLEDEEDEQDAGGQKNEWPKTPVAERELEVECDQIFAEVSVPLAFFSAHEQALYRMRVLLVNTQGVLDGAGHSWALRVGEEQCSDAYGTIIAEVSSWRTECSDAEGKIVDLLCQAGVDLQAWCYTEAPFYDEGELPDTPPLAWVQERKVAKRLFGLIDDEVSEELERAIAYALHALRESQPPSFRASLFLSDALALDQPTLEACNTRLSNRLGTLPALSSYADSIRAATSVEQVNEIMKEVYAVAPALGVWIIT